MDIIKQANPLPSENALQAVKRVLESGQYVKGKEGRAFEVEFKYVSGANYNLAVNSGTSALNLMFTAYDFDHNSEIITQPNSFLATANAIELSNLKTTFADIDYDTMNLDPENVRKAINKSTKAILAVHLYGKPSPMKELQEIADENGILLLEDACQAHGALYHGKKIGSIGDSSAFSLFPTKNLTVLGDGGIFSTNNEEIYNRVRMLRNAGRDILPDDAKLFGFNMRMSEMLAAVGREQLTNFKQETENRINAAKWYFELMSDIDQIILPKDDKDERAVWHQYTIRAENRDKLKKHLMDHKIQSGIKYAVPLHLVKAFVDKYKYSKGMFPNAEKHADHLLCLPMHPGLSYEDIERIAKAIKSFYK